MLAQPVGAFERITNDDWQDGLYIQPKLDGVRCLIQFEKGFNPNIDPSYDDRGKVVAYSRTGKEWKNIDHILEQLYPFFDKYPNVVLDGELYNHDLRDNFEKIISLVRKTKPTDEDRLESAEKVQFHCYDWVNKSLDFEGRNYFIQKHFAYNATFMPKIKTLQYGLVFNTEEVEVQHEELLEQGYEGSILRKNALYECKRSWNLLKVKDFSDSEAKIIDWVEGKGKRIGTIGKFQAVDADGNEFGMPVMDNFSYLQENFKEMQSWVGKTATFTYFERTKKGSYRHPLFKNIRDYE
jgi:ATP-dependent DNA ligase